ncbi:Nn.00g039570.m01.CDS01 [Neocucurbitaria sp. VM-36]
MTRLSGRNHPGSNIPTTLVWLPDHYHHTHTLCKPRLKNFSLSISLLSQRPRMPRVLPREDYTVGWVCARPIEQAAAKAVLDEYHRDVVYADNIYSLGSVAGHNVVIVCLPAGQIGNSPASTVAAQMQASFPGIRFGLMVGIGGGVPTEVDIRLGDVVVSQPHQNFGGVVQYDMGKTTPSGFQRTGSLNSPPRILLSALSKVQTNSMLEKSTLFDQISQLERVPIFQRSKAGPDVLFEATYNHESGSTCEQCSIARQKKRPLRETAKAVVVHYGTIASGNQVIKSAATRDKVSTELGGVLCFEMEAAGLMNNFPCLVIRGICDYADSHKNKLWQPYAAGTAAGYAKELLSVIPVANMMKTHSAVEAMCGANKRSFQSESPESAPAKRRKVAPCSPENGTVEQQTTTLPIHHRKPSQTSLSEEQKRSLLESLKFDQIDARQKTIKKAHAKTCKWLLKHTQYCNWLDTTKLDEHHGFLWIKGHPGTGKSTLMKFASVNARTTMKNRTVLSFFFNARGEDIEKATIGVYRSLLLQLFEQLPVLQSVFQSLSLSTASVSTSSFSMGHQWDLESLKTLLEQAILALGQSSVVCFIDALDECDEDQIRDMIRFFEHIGDLAVSNRICFRVCFSSRHYPHITIRNGLVLVLEGQEGHSQDITNYIETELKIEKSKTAQQIRADLQEKSSGIFMWVILVVEILNKESDRGRIHTLRQRLQDIPRDLHELFRDILTRDGQNQEGLVLCIQWVLFAKQPLSPTQLYLAIRSGIETVSEWDSEEITEEVIKRYLLDSSKGLAESTVSKVPKVQFIHESVRDFLLKDDGLKKIWPDLGDNLQAQSHERLKQCCLNYISVDVTITLKISDHLPKANTAEAAAMRTTADKTFPFMEYAVHNVLYHADAAEGGGITQTQFLDSFPLRRWVTLDNLFEKYQVRRHTDNVSLLYVLAELNLANLIKVCSSISQYMDVEDERYGCPLFAAAATGSDAAIGALIQGTEVSQSSERVSCMPHKRNAEIKPMQHVSSLDFTYSKRRGMLSCAADLGNEEVVSHLIDSGKYDAGLKDWNGRGPLWVASSKGQENILQLLLESGTFDMNDVDTQYGTPLYVAARNGYRTVVDLLLEKGANVNAEGGMYGNALLAASCRGDKEIVGLLLDKGANVNAEGGEYGNALQAAAYHGNKVIIALLLDKGADVNAQGGWFGNTLQAASYWGYKEIVILLLDKGANVNAEGGQYGNALQAAAYQGHKEIVVLLLDKGANVNAQGGEWGNALQAASYQGYKEIVVLLLDRGANVNVEGGMFSNALQAASYQGYKEIVALLLDKGAKVNAEGGNFSNALQAASYRGYKEIVVLLLDRGAYVNAQGGDFGNALQAACSGFYRYRSYQEVVALLLDRGANVNAQGGKYGNALQAARTKGKEDIVTLLLSRGAT